MLVKVYTDGAARGNPDGPGGYGAVLEYVDGKGQLHTKELSQGYTKTTNNRMELMAAIVGLEALNRPCQIQLYSDSKYLVDAFNQHWIDGCKRLLWERLHLVMLRCVLHLTSTGLTDGSKKAGNVERMNR